MQVLVQSITPTEEEKKVPYWNIMFDDVQPCRDATPEKETEGFLDPDHDSEREGRKRIPHIRGSVAIVVSTQTMLPNHSRRLEFRVNSELGERRVFYPGEKDEDTEVSEHNSNTEEVLKGMQLVHIFTHLQSYKRRKVGNILANEDFVVALDPMQIILKPNVEVFVDVLTCWTGSPSLILPFTVHLTSDSAHQRQALPSKEAIDRTP
ncbi:unnamed protein product [Malus baccata var. baccata]